MRDQEEGEEEGGDWVKANMTVTKAEAMAAGRTYQLFGLLKRSLRPTDGCFTWLSRGLLDLLKLLAEVGLDQLQLGFITTKALGASIGVDEVGHG